MLEQHFDEVVAFPLAGHSEDRLLAVVVARIVFAELLVNGRPAGEAAGGLLDIFLGIIADAEREEFHQLASQVLVRMPPAITRCIEPHQYRWIAKDSAKQGAER